MKTDISEVLHYLHSLIVIEDQGVLDKNATLCRVCMIVGERNVTCDCSEAYQ